MWNERASAVVVQSKVMHYGAQWTYVVVNPLICGLAMPLFMGRYLATDQWQLDNVGGEFANI